MNSLGKILVVFVTTTSLGFAAFALSLVSGGPNWKGEAESAEITDDFVITITAGEKPSYTVKTRRTGEAVGSSTPLLAEAVVAARARQLKDAKDQQTQLTQKIDQLKPVIANIKAMIPVDEAGVKARSETFEKQIDELNVAIKAATTDFTAKGGEIQQTRKTAQERREEGFRLKNQLELLRNDLFAAEKQQKALEDELVRAEENLKRLERREKQLKQQSGDYDK